MLTNPLPRFVQEFSSQLLHKLPYQPWLKRLIVISLVLGIGFRFYHLGHKVYWYDEVQTSLRISGYTRTEFIQKIYNSPPISVEALLKTYQYPTAEKRLKDSFHALAQHPEHSPLYYWLSRFWLQLVPDSIASIRLLSALISLLVFPALYWLCWELFQSATVGIVAIALVAIAPFHVLYAQEAREYSLWTVAILISTAALLKALSFSRLANQETGFKVRDTSGAAVFSGKPWIIYGLTVALNLYTHPLSSLVLMSHGIYTVLVPKPRKTQVIVAYLKANLLGLLLFLPWLIIVISNFDNFLENTESKTVSRPGLPLIWGLNLSRIFFDVNQGTSLLNPTLYFALFLTGYALYVLIRHTPIQTWLLIIILIGVPAMALMLPDIFWGGQRSAIARYGIPCYLGIQVAVAYLFTVKITEGIPGEISRKISRKIPGKAAQIQWKWIFIMLCLGGIISCLVSSQHQVWWHKSYAKSRYNPAVARVINQSNFPLIISDEEPGRILSLSHLLKPKAHLKFILEPNIPQLPAPNEFSDIFLYRPSEGLRQGLAQTYPIRLEQAYEKGWIWRVIPGNE